ncbi:MAG: hypothetical protein JWM91_3449 [Rhodospirillales bacterium]|nr:hypothetical protein [Rhodospirillales bacterium]
MNTLVPDGFEFSNADTVLCAKAVYKPRYQVENPASRSLDAFIKDDKTSFVEKNAEVLIINAHSEAGYRANQTCIDI